MEEKETQLEAKIGTSLPPKITKENINAHAGSKKQRIIQWIRAVAYTIISAFLVSISTYSLITPNNFTIGGVSGIAILLNVALKWDLAVLVFVLNAPLIVLSFFYVKKKFAVLTTLNVLCQSLWLLLIELLFPDFKIEFPKKRNAFLPRQRQGFASAWQLCLPLRSAAPQAAVIFWLYSSKRSLQRAVSLGFCLSSTAWLSAHPSSFSTTPTWSSPTTFSRLCLPSLNRTSKARQTNP